METHKSIPQFSSLGFSIQVDFDLDQLYHIVFHITDLFYIQWFLEH